MSERDIHAERQSDFAHGISSGNRDDLVKFHLAVSMKFGNKPISKALRDEEMQSTALVQAGRLLTLKIIGYSNAILKMDEPESITTGLRLTTAMFLLERTAAIRDAALKNDSLGLYSLYVSLRDDVCRLLGPTYYERSFKSIAGEYSDIEPAIMAASKLCGILPPPELANIPDLYKKALRQRVEAATPPV